MNHDALRAAAEVAYPEPSSQSEHVRRDQALYRAQLRTVKPSQVAALRQLLELLRDELAPELIPLRKKQAA